MTDMQRLSLRLQLIALLRLDDCQFHHGDCVGADEQFHNLVREIFGGFIVGHIPDDPTNRAFCVVDAEMPPLPYMQRNRAIVDAAHIMLAAPYEMKQQPYGGTWRTIALARKASKPLTIVWPDGTVTEERQ